MKITLFAINGGYTHTSLAIRCLARPLREAGFAVTPLERNLRDRTDAMLDALMETEADVYGLSCYIWNLPLMLTLAADLHALRPDAVIFAGGPEVSYATERFAGTAGIDYIVTGEGEAAVLGLCSALRDGVRPAERIIAGSPQPPGEGIAYPADEDLTGKLVYYESARGCPYRCAYCLSSRVEGIRAKGAEAVIADLRAFSGRGAKTVKLVDRTFNFDVRRANAIWAALADGDFAGEYHFEICAALLDEESVAILSRMPAGRVRLEVGLQSTNPATLAAVQRPIDPARVIDVLERLHRESAVHIHLDLIAGLPYEGYARFGESFDAAYFCCDVLQLGHLKLLYGTKLREEAAQYGYVCAERPPYAVLRSNWIDYGELRRLDAVADLLERYRDSGRFARGLDVLIARGKCSPFARWCGLLDDIAAQDGRPIARISQPDAYRLLHGYAGKVLTGEEYTKFDLALAADWDAAEPHRRRPWG